jgi:hypothetical protein
MPHLSNTAWGILLAICAPGTVLSQDLARAYPERNQIVVSPNGPEDEGDYGQKTPGAKTSGLQEALDAAKAQAKDVYLAGGSWTADKTTPVVYHLNATLHIPWMQNFRLDSGHCVLNYTPNTGDAVVFDSQMRKVITSTEFVFNALVGGGGAWPSGEAYNSDLDKTRPWIGTGLWLDGSEGSIDANKTTVIETVGCAVGLLLTGAATRNTIEETNIHLCRDHIRLGGPEDSRPSDNRSEAFMDCQGIEPSSGARVFSSRNLLTLSARPFPKGPQLVFEKNASDNLAIIHSRGVTVDQSLLRSNRLIAVGVPNAEDMKRSPLPAGSK